MQVLAFTKVVWQGSFSFAKGILDWMGWFPIVYPVNLRYNKDGHHDKWLGQG